MIVSVAGMIIPSAANFNYNIVKIKVHFRFFPGFENKA